MKNKIYDAIDMIQIVLNEVGIKKADGNNITFDILHLGRLPKSKLGLDKITEKAIGFEIGTTGYLLEPKGMMSDNELHFDIDDAPISAHELKRMRGAIQKLYDEKVVILSNTLAITESELSESEEESLDDFIESLLEKYKNLFK